VTPSPEQIQAAMPVMREYLAEAFAAEGYEASADAVRGRTSDAQVVAAMNELGWYRGGVAQFIADQEGRRG
jgi:hypothetical protein